MKRCLKRFIIILILITMALEIVLPMNVSFADDTSIYFPDSFYTPIDMELIPEDGEYCAITYSISSNGERLTDFGNEGSWHIYYEENGERKMPTSNGNGVVTLKKGVQYYVLHTLNGEAYTYEIGITRYDAATDLTYGKGKISYTPQDYYENLNISETSEKYLHEGKTGWYRAQDLAHEDLVHQIYYEDIDEANNVQIKYPTVTEKNNSGPIVYLVKGKVYNKPKNLYLEETHLTLLEDIEAMIARFVYSIANGLHYLVGVALGESVTIDDLVFNNYAETNISYFDTEEEAGANASPLIYGTNEVGGLNSVINKWYSIFIKIALMCYMVILVYMGIRIILTSTAEEKASYKKLFVDWIIGIAILFLFPYVMKYMIDINEAFVETIEKNKGYEDRVSSALSSVDYDKNFLDISIDEEIDWSKGNDYMSLIANSAYQTDKAALSFAFLIMTWQLITLLFHYYKRLFMIGFLIIIFPLVGLSYAIDKIADGKSQAFNTWVKEFMLNVFVQTFHAIVYVFVCSTVYSASGINDSIGYDFILIIVGVTFLFRGEEIIRQIFGQVSTSGTMKSLSDNAVATFAKFRAAEVLVKKVGEYTVGSKSIPSKLRRGANEIGAINSRLKAFDKTATTPEDYNTGARLEHAPNPPPENASEEEKKNFLMESEYFKAAAIFNNPNSHSYSEKAKALDTLKKLAIENPEHNVFKDTRATAGQIIAMANLDYNVQGMIQSGMNRIDIERQVTATLGVIFSGESDEKVKDKANTYFTSLYFNGSNNSVSKNKIRREINDIIKETKDIQNSIVFLEEHKPIENNGEIITPEVIDEIVKNEAIDMYHKYEDELIELTEPEKDVAKKYAINVAILKERNSGAYTEKELLEAATYVRNHKEDNDVTNQMAEEDFGIDTDVFMHTLSKKVVEESNSEDAKKIAQSEVSNYESNPREGYFSDEISVHQVIKDMKNQEEVDKIIEEIYQNKKKAMKEATEEIAKEYLVENEVDSEKGSYDITRQTQDGKTQEELLAMKVDAIGRTLSSLLAINKESASKDSGAVGILGWIMKEYLARKEEERTGITRSIEAYKDVRNPVVTTQDFIEKNKQERDKIQNEHFMGDIGDRKD